MTNRDDIAVQKFSEGYNCAQAVVFAWSDDVHLDKEIALKLACGFGGGMGRKGEVCGAVTGGLLVIGARYGRGENDDRAVTQRTYAKVSELMEKFQSTYGTVLCRQLLNVSDLTTEEGQRYIQEHDLTNKVCKNCVRSAVQILEDVL